MKNLILYIILSLFVSLSYADKLTGFKKKVVTKKDKSSEKASSKKESPASSLSSGISSSLTEVIFKAAGYVLITGGANSLEHARNSYSIDQKSTQKANDGYRLDGSPMLPFVRFDASLGELEKSIKNIQARGELGWGPIALEGRILQFQEDEIKDRLRLMSWHGIYRMTFSKYLEVGLGFGTTMYDAEQWLRGFSIMAPIKLYLGDTFGIQYRSGHAFIGAYGITEQNLSGIISARGVSIAGGYKWLSSGLSELEGPFIEASFHY
jgi:hypothetical protein